MKKLRLICAMGAVLSMFASVGAVPVFAAPRSQQCTGSFEGNVTSGPDAGLTLAGTITLRVEPNGRIEGVFVETDGSRVQVEGRFSAPMIKLRFELPRDESIVGTGELPGGFTPCTSNFGGTFKGPQHNDRGDWGIIWGS